MNCERVQQLWDDYRDGLLAGAEARGLEQHLADCPECEALWRSESGWLRILGEKTPIAGDAEAAVFTEHVLRRWSRSHQPSAIGRIVRLSAAAAVVAAMISLATTMVQHERGLVEAPTEPAAQFNASEVLLAQVDAPVVAVRQAFDTTSQLLDGSRYVNSFVELLDATAPPPQSQNVRMQ